MKSGWIALEPAEPVGVVSLSGPVDPARLQAGLEVLAGWGHPTIVAPNVRVRTGYLAGEDGDRVEGLAYVLDRGARVIIASRGGYGSTRILDRLPWRRLRDDSVCLVGFSDLTAVLNTLAMEGGPHQVHGPMVAAGLSRPSNARRLRDVLAGRLEGRTLFRFNNPSVARHGRVSGPAYAFNLSLLAALCGTPHMPDLSGSVVFLEEVGEPLYRIDRMLTQIAASGRFRGVKALISGSLCGCRPVAERDETWRRLVMETAPHEAVIVTGLPFGHAAANMAVPIGVPVEVDTGRGRVRWSS